MRTAVLAAFAALIILSYSSCKKENVSPQAIKLESEQSSSFVYATGTTIGRQKVIELTTGDYYYPTSQALLWLPQSYYNKTDVNKIYPLIIALGGIDQNGSTDINVVLNGETIAKRIANGWNAEVVDPIKNVLTKFIVFSPEKSERKSWGWSAPAIKTMLDQLKKKYRVNPSRVYITGLSAGGWGLWSCITDDTLLCKQFAAIGPVSSAGADHPDKISHVDKYGIACWNICGTADSFYPLAISYTGIINSNKPLIKPVLTGLLNIGHNAWNYAYDPAWKPNGINFYQWLLKYTKHGK